MNGQAELKSNSALAIHLPFSKGVPKEMLGLANWCFFWATRRLRHSSKSWNGIARTQFISVIFGLSSSNVGTGRRLVQTSYRLATCKQTTEARLFLVVEFLGILSRAFLKIIKKK